MNASFQLLYCVVFMCWMFKSAYSIWRIVPQFSGRVSNIDYQKSWMRSRIHCAASCDRTAPCVAFIFAKSQPLNCQLLANTKPLSSRQYSNVSDAQYFGFECGIPDSLGYHHVDTNGPNNFAYKVHYTVYSRLEAMSACESEGGTLFRLATPLKYHTIVSLIQTCEDYSNVSRYIVDGSNVDAADFFNINEWKFSNNEPLPPTMWMNPNLPNDPGVSHCACLKKHRNWGLADCRCSSGDALTLCEK